MSFPVPTVFRHVASLPTVYFSSYFIILSVQGKLSLTTPQSALLTEKYACKIFGNENAIGKVLRYSNGKDITVEGIVGEPEC